MAMSKRLYNMLHGFGSLLLVFPPAKTRFSDISNHFHNRPSIEDTFRGDWERLGEDMNRAITKVTCGKR